MGIMNSKLAMPCDIDGLVKPPVGQEAILREWDFEDVLTRVLGGASTV
jgi:hypothetical protein